MWKSVLELLLKGQKVGLLEWGKKILMLLLRYKILMRTLLEMWG